MKDKIIELLKQYEDTHTQGVYRCDYDELADEVVKLFCQPDVSGRSEQLKAIEELIDLAQDCCPAERIDYLHNIINRL